MTGTSTARVRALEDRNEILELLADYCHTLDRGLEEAFYELWVDDGVWEFRPPLGRYEGRDRIMEAWREIRKQTGDVQHVTADTVVKELRDDSAVVRSTGIMQADLGGATPVVMFLTFDDVVRRVDGRWRFASRRVGYTGEPLVDVNELSQ